MAAKFHSLQVYEELAAWYDRQGQAKLRDWFLVLAADAATSLGQPDQAERLRKRLLHVNPHHLLRPFASFAEALQSPDVQGYVADLRRTYPLETAEQLLVSTQKKPAEPPVLAPALHREERELKVYRGKEKTPEETPPRQAANPPPAAPPMPLPVAWTRPSLPASLRRSRMPTPSPVDRDEGARGIDYWVSTALFALTLGVAAALAGYVLVWPLCR